MKIYIIGIGGAGTSALAIVYKKQGHEVSGSDNGDGFYIPFLQKNNIFVYDDFCQRHLTDDIDMIVHTTAIEDTNCELKEAKKRGFKIYTYPEAIGLLTKKIPTISVCGTHGKTTTTAIMAHAFVEAQQLITAIVGSPIVEWQCGAYYSGEKYFILESDEYQNKLSFYAPQYVIVTNIDFDHPDFFRTKQEYYNVFTDYLNRVPRHGIIVACGDDDNVKEVINGIHKKVLCYGFESYNDCVVLKRERKSGKQYITILYENKQYIIKTQLYGKHNALNAVAAWLLSVSILPCCVDSLIKGIEKFSGTSRRFERHGQLNGAELIDDYAHHPQEINATLDAVKEMFPHKKIIVAFHPHTFTRTQQFLHAFTQALNKANYVIVLNIYASAREKKGNVSAQDLVQKINHEDNTENKSIHIETIDELSQWMKKFLTKNDVFVTLGAGDIWKVYEQIK